MEFKPYLAEETLTDYYPVPRSVLELGLSTTAVLMYGVLLDRATLSRKYGFSDVGGWLYVVYPVLELCALLNLGPTTVKKCLNALEEAGLIRRIRRRRQEANRIFLLVPTDSLTDRGRDGNQTSEGRKTGSQRVGKVSPNNRKEQQNRINAYQHEEGESL